MSIEFMDNFSQYGTDETNMEDGIYAEALLVILEDDPDGVSGGKVLKVNSTSGVLRRVLSAAKTTVGIGLRLWIPSLPGDATERWQFMVFADTDNSRQITVLVNTTGTISVYRGTSSGTLLGTTAVPALTAGAWHHVETKVLFSQTIGTVEIRVNEEVVLSLTGQDTCSTANVECSQVRVLAAISTAKNFYYKDLIVWNGDGSSNNDFLGDVQIVTLLPTADDTFTGWASTGANGFSVIDETTPSDADYITADVTDTTAAVFTLSNLDPDVTSVKGLMTVVRALKSDAGTANLQVGLVSGASTDSGDDRPMTTSATYWTDISELDPNTASAWTRTTVDAAKLSIDRTA